MCVSSDAPTCVHSPGTTWKQSTDRGGLPEALPRESFETEQGQVSWSCAWPDVAPARVPYQVSDDVTQKACAFQTVHVRVGSPDVRGTCLLYFVGGLQSLGEDC